ncbi:MAG: hypothetical protein OEX02_15230 [Cyclobacteriaceae bacterium]|nr:hypothetical protein [Cyclobacteriaceae bacterium]
MKPLTQAKWVLLTFVMVFSITTVYCQQDTQSGPSITKSEKQPQEWKHSIGSSLFLLRNLDTKEPPMYFQLNYGHQLAPGKIIIAEAITWAYYRPLGMQWWDASEDKYPGKIRAFGIGAGYQHFYVKGLYSTVQVTPFLQKFYDNEDSSIQSGFQLWCQFRVGYRVEFFNKRWFVEPSVVCNYWPVNTNFPAPFEVVENNWPNYFLFEPGLHFGVKF